MQIPRLEWLLRWWSSSPLFLSVSREHYPFATSLQRADISKLNEVVLSCSRVLRTVLNRRMWSVTCCRYVYALCWNIYLHLFRVYLTEATNTDTRHYRCRRAPHMATEPGEDHCLGASCPRRWWRGRLLSACEDCEWVFLWIRYPWCHASAGNSGCEQGSCQRRFSGEWQAWKKWRWHR